MLAAFVACVVGVAAGVGWGAGRLGRRIPDPSAAGGWARLARPVALLALLGALALSALLVTFLASLAGPAGFDVVADADVRFVCRSVVATLAGNVAAVAGALGLGLDLGLSAPRVRDPAAAVGLAVGALVVSAGWSTLLGLAGLSPEQEGYAFLAGEGEPAARALVGAFVLVGAPVTEELLWRGVLLGGALRVLSARAAVLLLGVAFGLAHGADPLAVPPIVVLGVGLCALRAGSGSTWPGVLAHVLYNGAGLAILGLGG